MLNALHGPSVRNQLVQPICRVAVDIGSWEGWAPGSLGAWQLGSLGAFCCVHCLFVREARGHTTGDWNGLCLAPQIYPHNVQRGRKGRAVARYWCRALQWRPVRPAPNCCPALYGIARLGSSSTVSQYHSITVSGVNNVSMVAAPSMMHCLCFDLLPSKSIKQPTKPLLWPWASCGRLS